MDPLAHTHLDNLTSPDRSLQNAAYTTLMQATEGSVDWAYEAWDELIAGLTHPDNKVRAIAAQVLANLARSDPEKRILGDFDALLNVTRDERFVTARHCLQSIWKVGTAGPEQMNAVVAGLDLRYAECVTEKNATLIRYDILVCMRRLYDFSGQEDLREKALAWIEKETDPKYRTKYMGLWRTTAQNRAG